MDTANSPPPIIIPQCLQVLASERRWVAWRWEKRNGKRTKPPICVRDDCPSRYARNNDPDTWAMLPEAIQAVESGGLDGIGLQLLDLNGFAAIDLDNVRDPSDGSILPWVQKQIEECASYVEITPSGRGLRILGQVSPQFPPTHTTERVHPDGGKFEVYANTATGRFITVSGDRLPHSPDLLTDIDDPLHLLLSLGTKHSEEFTNATDTDPAILAAFEALSRPLQQMISHTTGADRSVQFQQIVNSLYQQVPKATALDLLRAFPNGPAGKYKGRLEDEFDRSWRKAEQRDSRQRSGATRDADADKDDDITEDAVARLFTARHGKELRYDHERESWIRWPGDRWERDRTQWALFRCRKLAQEMSRGAGKRTRRTTGRAGFVAGAERLARADPVHAVTQEIWDHDPLLLGVPGGVIDLRTGYLGPADPEQYITRKTGVAPVDSQTCPRWKAFLAEATGGDDDLIAYIQRLVGYSLTGETREHMLAFFYGPGGNGKSVFVNTICGILGDYAATAPMDTFTTSRGERHPTELAMLRGARLVTASETEEGRAWAESRIKQMTGGDRITARFMRQDFFTYTPQFKLLIIGNHKPVLRSVDDAARRRFQIVPFTHKPHKPDPYLEEKLREEWPGILRWAINGCLAWQSLGLVPPAVVRSETEAYFGAQDLVGQWIEEECVTAPGNAGHWEAIGVLFESWRAYSEAAGEPSGTKKALAEALDQRGFPGRRQRVNGKQVRIRLGISLRWKERSANRDRDG